MFGNAQKAFDQFYAVVHEAIEYNKPLRPKKTKDDKPWMTPNIKNMIIERQRLFHSGQQIKWKSMCNRIQSAIKKRKWTYNRRFTSANADLWKRKQP